MNIVLIFSYICYSNFCELKQGTVIKTTGSWHLVRYMDQDIACKIKGKFRIKGIKTTNPVAVGDHVKFELPEDNETGIITEILKRKNYIIRKASNLSKESHLLAANVDQAFLMITLKYPETTSEFIDRFLVTSEAYHIPTVLVFNKTDLYDKEFTEKMRNYISVYSAIGYTCVECSVKEIKNLDILKNMMLDKINLIAGNSGVGKSSLLNSLDKKLNLKTGDISSYHKTGKHTTTFPQMFELNEGGFVIDTPGIRGFGLIDFAKNEIGLYFPEIFKLSKNCQYYNCTHTHEPNCAVKNALAEGKLAETRYKSYINIFTDDNEKYRSPY
jgi:ribosome biogenesis GTPase / thiamine phosphate phosphatase